MVSEQFFKDFTAGRVGVLCNDREEKCEVVAWAQRCGLKLGPCADTLLKYGETDMGYPIVFFDTKNGIITATKTGNKITRIPYSDFNEAHDCDDIDDDFDDMLFGIMSSCFANWKETGSLKVVNIPYDRFIQKQNIQALKREYERSYKRTLYRPAESDNESEVDYYVKLVMNRTNESEKY